MRIILFISALLLGIPAVAQQGIIKGVVTDATSGETLIGVNIVTGENVGVTTDVNGQYELKLDPGVYEISYKYVGFDAEKFNVKVSSNDEIIRNVGLQPSVSQLDMVVVSAGRYEQQIEELT